MNILKPLFLILTVLSLAACSASRSFSDLDEADMKRLNEESNRAHAATIQQSRENARGNPI
jgi:hypothetical protein